ncbi:nuclear movement protein nudC [Onthophagus taurus]|uniref:nuclear movement protein nudC n=1 Tax=Onthophagus taurus TaxID=166361 RepID=UPI000C20F68C|nr:nudC domain-containing protein 3 [Onthophagus taurus]XP_022900298.1 nudC domain-containing protein 3 [Onthophagus taurus]
MCDIERFDDSLFAILKECRTLPNFFDAVFGFLNRRTDFYVISTNSNSHVGLPEGFAERFVRNTFYKWKPKDLNKNEVPEAVIETEIETEVEIDDETDNNKGIAMKSDDIEGDLRKLNVENDKNVSDSYNGGVFDNYSWSQTISDVDVLIKTPFGVTSKDLIVAIHPNKISIKTKKSSLVLIEDELCNCVKNSEAIWSLDVSQRKLTVHLEKRSEIWWDCLLKSEPKLDLSKMDCSRPFEELPDEAQAKIEELQWNQERKRLGLPTSDEIKMRETLKKAWNAEGSPFVGDFDPSSVNFN